MQQILQTALMRQPTDFYVINVNLGTQGIPYRVPLQHKVELWDGFYLSAKKL
jgi:hypothetical protein